jgi:TPP-dependent pyruvate/acetoin dehydrogenase alpha subunit
MILAPSALLLRPTMITSHTRESLIAFENRIRDLFAAGELPYLVHLSGGNEGQLLEIFREVKAEDWVFSTHRSHYHALLKGIPPAQLEEEILAGRSMFVFDRERRFVTSSILGGVCAMAAGVALAIKQNEFEQKGTKGTKSGGCADAGGSSFPSCSSVKSPRVWVFLGDGAEDNGHTYEAIRFVTGHDLPCTFVIEDNDRQVDTAHAERWGTETRFAWDQGPGTRDQETQSSKPKTHVIRYHYTPTFPHGGAGLKTMVAFKPEAVERAKRAWA